MTDRRLPPTGFENKGEVKAVCISVADLRTEPNGKRDRQLIYGENFRVLEIDGNWSYGCAQKDGYTGYLRNGCLTKKTTPTHFISSRSSHLYPEPDFKAEEISALSFASYIEVISQGDRFAELANGSFVPNHHIKPIEQLFNDPVEVASRFMDVPYLWGGNSIWGLDCSGLVQVSMLACGISCAGDADLQETSIGKAIGDNVKPKRGDIFFWKGHVGLIADENTLLHANAYHMAVVEEPLDKAIERIKEQGDGPVTSRRRL